MIFQFSTTLLFNIQHSDPLPVIPSLFKRQITIYVTTCIINMHFFKIQQVSIYMFHNSITYSMLMINLHSYNTFNIYNVKLNFHFQGIFNNTSINQNIFNVLQLKTYSMSLKFINTTKYSAYGQTSTNRSGYFSRTSNSRSQVASSNP